MPVAARIFGGNPLEMYQRQTPAKAGRGLPGTPAPCILVQRAWVGGRRESGRGVHERSRGGPV